MTLSKCLQELNLKHQSVIANRIEETDFDVVTFTACGLTPVNKNLQLEGNDLGNWVVKRFKSGLFKVKEIVTRGAWFSLGVK